MSGGPEVGITFGVARYLLVTNDFPPKLGGIQSYLFQLWRRLDPTRVAVLTTPYHGSAAFDAAQEFPIARDRDPVFVAHPGLVRRIEEQARRHRADLVVLDPVLPLGAVGPFLSVPYGVVVHGAEVTVPAMAPPVRAAMARVLQRAAVVVAAGSFPAAEAERVAGSTLPVVNIPPGVDSRRFRPLTPSERHAVRQRHGVAQSARLVVSLSRLVPRKGMDTLIEASARLAPEFPDLEVLIGGSGRDRRRLERLAERTRAPVRLVGRVSDDDLPAFYGMADVYAMCCRNRWLGIEQEGFGIVFLEAAACGVPQIAGSSGGSADAVAHGSTGLVVGEPASVGAVTSALRRLVMDEQWRSALGDAAHRRATAEFDYGDLAERLDRGLAGAVGRGVGR